MLKKDYYEILGVPKTATTAQIKRAFKKVSINNYNINYLNLACIEIPS